MSTLTMQTPAELLATLSAESCDAGVIKMIAGLAQSKGIKCSIMGNADALDLYNMPRGVVVVVDKDTPMRADWMRRKSISALAVMSVQDPQHRSEHVFTSNEIRDKLQDAVAQYSQQPPLLEGSNGHKDIGGHWEAELGERGFVGLYRNTRRSRRDENGLFIAARCHVPASTHDAYYTKWMARARAGDLVAGDPDMLRDNQIMANFAKRSACRLMHSVAQALDLEVAVDVDRGSVYSSSNEFTAPRLVVPDHIQVSNAITLHGTDKVHIDNASALLGGGHALNKASRSAILMLGPGEGLAIAPLTEKAWRSGALITVGTRRLCAPGSDNNDATASDALPTDRDAYVWEGEATSELHNYLMGAQYAAPDGDFYANLEDAGVNIDPHASTILDPLCVKIGNPALVRPQTATTSE